MEWIAFIHRDHSYLSLFTQALHPAQKTPSQLKKGQDNFGVATCQVDVLRLNVEEDSRCGERTKGAQKREDGAHFAQGRSSVGRMHVPRALLCISSSPSSSPQLPPLPTLKGHSILEVEVSKRLEGHKEQLKCTLQLQGVVHIPPPLCKCSLSGHANCERMRRCRGRRKVICGRDRARRVLARPPTNQPCHHWQWRWEEGEGGSQCPKGAAGLDGRKGLFQVTPMPRK